jgi:hypothetical protein
VELGGLSAGVGWISTVFREISTVLVRISTVLVRISTVLRGISTVLVGISTVFENYLLSTNNSPAQRLYLEELHTRRNSPKKEALLRGELLIKLISLRSRILLSHLERG